MRSPARSRAAALNAHRKYSDQPHDGGDEEPVEAPAETHRVSPRPPHPDGAGAPHERPPSRPRPSMRPTSQPRAARLRARTARATCDGRCASVVDPCVPVHVNAGIVSPRTIAGGRSIERRTAPGRRRSAPRQPDRATIRAALGLQRPVAESRTGRWPGAARAIGCGRWSRTSPSLTRAAHVDELDAAAVERLDPVIDVRGTRHGQVHRHVAGRR